MNRLQVCNLDLSKRLHELGVNCKSLYSYLCHYNDLHKEERVKLVMQLRHVHPKENAYHSYTVAELGLILKNVTQFWEIKSTFEEFVFSVDDKLKIYLPPSGVENESDIRALFLIYLIENGLVNIGDINAISIS